MTVSYVDQYWEYRNKFYVTQPRRKIPPKPANAPTTMVAEKGADLIEDDA